MWCDQTWISIFVRLECISSKRVAMTQWIRWCFVLSSHYRLYGHMRLSRLKDLISAYARRCRGTCFHLFLICLLLVIRSLRVNVNAMSEQGLYILQLVDGTWIALNIRGSNITVMQMKHSAWFQKEYIYVSVWKICKVFSMTEIFTGIIVREQLDVYPGFDFVV